MVTGVPGKNIFAGPGRILVYSRLLAMLVFREPLPCPRVCATVLGR